MIVTHVTSLIVAHVISLIVVHFTSLIVTHVPSLILIHATSPFVTRLLILSCVLDVYKQLAFSFHLEH